MSAFYKSYSIRTASTYTLAITVPQWFCQQQGITTGSIVSLYIENRQLVLTPDRRDIHDRIFLRTATLRANGHRGVTVTIPSHFKDLHRLKKGGLLDCHISNKEVFYKKH